jgi:hypothetical protein
MRRVRRLIRRRKLVRYTKYHDVETEAPQPLEPPLRINSSNQPPFQIDYSSQLPVQENAVNKPPVKLERAPRKPFTDYVSLAIKAGKEFNQKTSLEHIDKVAKDLFKFDIDPHVHVTMPDVVAQEIFDWIVTLKDRPMFEQAKLKLARKFIASLASESSPVEKPDALQLLNPSNRSNI